MVDRESRYDPRELHLPLQVLRTGRKGDAQDVLAGIVPDHPLGEGDVQARADGTGTGFFIDREDPVLAIYEPKSTTEITCFKSKSHATIIPLISFA